MSLVGGVGGGSISRTSGFSVDQVVPLPGGSKSTRLSWSCFSCRICCIIFVTSGEQISTISGSHCWVSHQASALPVRSIGSGSRGYCVENTGGRIAVRVCILWHIVCQSPFHRLLWDMRSADVTASIAGWDFKRLSVSLALTAAPVTEGVKNAAGGSRRLHRSALRTKVQGPVPGLIPFIRFNVFYSYCLVLRLLKLKLRFYDL